MMRLKRNKHEETPDQTNDQSNKETHSQPAIPEPMRNDIDLKPKHKKEHQKGTYTHADVKGQPGDPREETDAKEARIQYLRGKSDRTLEEGLELRELELGVKKAAEENAGWTSAKVHEDQKILRANEKEVREENREENN